MKNPINTIRLLAQTPTAMAAVATLAICTVPVNSARAATALIQNPLSAFSIEPDGAYTGSDPNSSAQWTGEWSDITPAWFISNDTTGATKTFLGDPNANSLLFAGLSRDTPTSQPELYLMYDYLGRTLPPPSQGNQFLASVSFPLTINGTSHNITVSFQTQGIIAAALGTSGTSGGSSVNVTVSVDGGPALPASDFGLEAGLGMGVTPVDSLWGITADSPFHTTSHELIELGVPLDISAAFAAIGGQNSPFTPSPSDNGYSPAPAFWESDIVDDAGDPPASGGAFMINPDGSTTIMPTSVSVPEPGNAGLIGLGISAVLGVRRLRRRTA